MTAIETALLEDPTLVRTLEALQQTLKAERLLREAFYDKVTEEVKAEFINGQIVMHSPATNRHSQVRKNLTKLLDTYVECEELGTVRDEKALCIFPRNDYEPDVVFFGREKAVKLRRNTRKFPIPDFICEVLSDSTVERDRGVKYRDFEAHGVAEYWIIDPERETLEQYLPRHGSYELTLKSSRGEVTSAVVPGFTVPIRALFDDAENLRVLRSILA